jgi:hypothetical protein
MKMNGNSMGYFAFYRPGNPCAPAALTVLRAAGLGLSLVGQRIRIHDAHC